MCVHSRSLLCVPRGVSGRRRPPGAHTPARAAAVSAPPFYALRLAHFLKLVGVLSRKMAPGATVLSVSTRLPPYLHAVPQGYAAAYVQSRTAAAGNGPLALAAADPEQAPYAYPGGATPRSPRRTPGAGAYPKYAGGASASPSGYA